MMALTDEQKHIIDLSKRLKAIKKELEEAQ